MPGRVLLLLSTLSTMVACATAPVAPDWYRNPPECLRCYHGLGEGETYNTAKNRAKMDLCDDLRVVVSSEMETRRTQILRDSTGGGKNIDYNEVVDLVERSKSNCVFEGMSLQEEPRSVTVGNKVYVRLVLGNKNYVDWLAGRAVAIQTIAESSLSQGAASSLSGALSGCVRELGYLPHSGAKKRPFRLETTFPVTVSETGTGGLLVGKTHPVVRLVDTRSGQIRWEKDLGSLVARGFSREKLIDDLVEMVVAGLDGMCDPE